ncbi:MAG: 50S ribosomal protein L17 [Candidatus Wildermuthbacteria bacterium]|nr:50S ribosomal protein L17 [Candidatus Wildermuthbacteria bacterium]
MKNRKFSRKPSVRRAFLRSLVRALVLKDRIKTTEARAKELSSAAEKVVTTAKRGGLAARRSLLRSFDDLATKKLVDELGPRFKERAGGYTRIVKIGPRKSDGAKMAIIEFVK